jgi:hypothetical protein
VANSVIIGGENTTAEESNTVYVPQLVIRDGDKIKAGAGDGILEFNQYNDAILSTNKPFDNSIIGIFSSTSSSTHLTGKNGILVRDTLTSSTTPSWQSAVSFISTEFSNVEAGVYNTVIIGGNNLSATQSDTVYLGNNVNINNSYYLPTSDGTSAQALYTDGNGNLYNGGNTHIGNIFYPQGIAVITNQDYQNMFPLPPLAVADIINVKASDYNKTGNNNNIYVIINNSRIENMFNNQKETYMIKSLGKIEDIQTIKLILNDKVIKNYDFNIINKEEYILKNKIEYIVN